MAKSSYPTDFLAPHDHHQSAQQLQEKEEEIKHLNERLHKMDIDFKQMEDQANTFERNYNALLSKNPDKLRLEHDDLMK